MHIFQSYQWLEKQNIENLQIMWLNQVKVHKLAITAVKRL